MAKIREEQLDDTVAGLLDGTDLPGRIGLTLELVTIGDDGAPHPALLSVGEVLAVDRRRLRLGLWASSTTTANLTSRPDALLTLVAGGSYYGLQLSARRLPDPADVLPGLAAFTADVVVAHRDEVGYAELTHGITFRLREPESVLQRWSRTLEALRQVGGEPTTPGGAA